MTEETLKTAVYELGFQPARFTTSWGDMACPTPGWVREMDEWLVTAARALGIADYRTGAVNCKIYSLWAKSMVEVAYGRQATAAKQPAVGAFYFQHRSGEYHASLLFIHSRRLHTFYDLTWRLGGQDPFYDLTPKEKESCDWLFF